MMGNSFMDEMFNAIDSLSPLGQDQHCLDTPQDCNGTPDQIACVNETHHAIHSDHDHREFLSKDSAINPVYDQNGDSVHNLYDLTNMSVLPWTNLDNYSIDETNAAPGLVDLYTDRLPFGENQVATAGWAKALQHNVIQLESAQNVKADRIKVDVDHLSIQLGQARADLTRTNLSLHRLYEAHQGLQDQLTQSLAEKDRVEREVVLLRHNTTMRLTQIEKESTSRANRIHTVKHHLKALGHDVKNNNNLLRDSFEDVHNALKLAIQIICTHFPEEAQLFSDVFEQYRSY